MKRLGGVVSDSIGGVASGVEMVVAEGGLGSGLVLGWDSALDLCLGFERAMAVSLVKVERCWVVLWGMRSRLVLGVKNYGCCSRDYFWNFCMQMRNRSKGE